MFGEGVLNSSGGVTFRAQPCLAIQLQASFAQHLIHSRPSHWLFGSIFWHILSTLLHVQVSPALHTFLARPSHSLLGSISRHALLTLSQVHVCSCLQSLRASSVHCWDPSSSPPHH